MNPDGMLTGGPGRRVRFIEPPSPPPCDPSTQQNLLKDIAVEVANTFGPDDVEAAKANVEAWFQARFKEPLRYESLLDQIAPKSLERQQRLRRYFEPTPEDIEAGRKQPTPAHNAIADLVASGHIQVVVTLNFDHLIETALRQRGLQPLVIHAAFDLAELPALKFLPPAVVVHLHGDYTIPNSMLNTDIELNEYPPGTDEWLNRLLSEHGLIAIGWSAEYDKALINVVRNVPNRPFSSYWVEPFDPRPNAKQLADDVGLITIKATADDALPLLAAAVTALDDKADRHPRTLDVAIARAKRELNTNRTAVAVHDMLRTEIATLQARPELNLAHFNEFGLNPKDPDPFNSSLEEATQIVAGLLATVIYWGDVNSDKWWAGDIERLAQPLEGFGGSSDAIHRVQLPGLLLFHTAGVAALAAGRYDLLGKLFQQTRLTFNGQYQHATELLRPSHIYNSAAPSERVHRFLSPLFVDQLGLSKATYDDHWQTFEVLRAAEAFNQRTAPAYIQKLVSLRVALSEARVHIEVLKGTNDLDHIEDAEGSYRRIDRELNDFFDDLAQGLANAERTPLHLRLHRTHEVRFGYRPDAVRKLKDQLQIQGERHWLCWAGILGSNWQVALEILNLLEKAIEARSRDVYGNRDRLWWDTTPTP